MRNVIWSEKYRPTTLADCILPTRLRKQFATFAKDGAPHMILTGSAGLGKTSAMLALMNDIKADYLKLNGSLDRNIDTLRVEVQDFVSTVSWSGGRKYVYFDEIDNLNSESTQLALRGFSDEYSESSSIIGTCNYPGRLDDALLSRFIQIDFTIKPEEKVDIARQYFARLKWILDQEGIAYEDAVLAKLIMLRFPDFRMIIGACQAYAAQNDGKIDSGVLISDASKRLGELVTVMKSRDYKALRVWVAENTDLSYSSIYRAFYDSANKFMKPQSIPGVVLAIAKYLDMHARSVDHEITLTAGITEIMMSVEWLSA